MEVKGTDVRGETMRLNNLDGIESGEGSLSAFIFIKGEVLHRNANIHVFLSGM